MKKIDILNFITNFRKEPNEIKTHSELLGHLGVTDESVLQMHLSELKQTGVIKEIEHSGERAYQVARK